MRTILISTAAVLLFSFAAAGQKRPAAPVIATPAAIDRYVRSVEAGTKTRKEPDLVTADTAAADSDKPPWKKFSSSAALEKARDKQETYTIAFSWRKAGKIVQSNFTYFSPSGDWSQYVYHYFRADGSLARVDAELRTFMDDCVIRQKFYFDTKAKRIKKTLGYFDLTTDKPKKRCLGADALQFDYSTTVAKLPFKDR